MQLNKTAIVTGAAGGMGQATCRRLCAEGWQVLAIDHNGAGLDQLASELPALAPLVTGLDDTNLIPATAALLEQLPPVQGLVNMAGISAGRPITELQDEDWDRSFAINLTPAMRLIRLVAPSMQAQGLGSIVNVGSPVGVVGANKPAYAASKAALQGLTMSVARNLGGQGVRANLLLPGPTITGMTHDWPEERRQAVANGTFLKRLCQPDEVAGVVLFLLSEQASYMTGSVVDLSAGSLWGH